MPKPSPQSPPSAPPADSFWRTYSPHHEMPVALAASVTLHVLLGVVIVVSGLAIAADIWGETRPPELKVAFIQASGEPDSGGGGGGDPTPAGPNKEFINPKDAPKTDVDPTPTTRIDVIPEKPPQDIDIPSIPTTDIVIPKFEVVSTPKPGTNNPGKGGPGTGGGLGAGVGSGVGPGKGPGSGPGNPGLGGGPATRAEILAQRWRFNFSGSPRDHLQKLIASGITLGFKDHKNEFYLINDLKSRPVTWKPAPFDQYKDSVKWYSQAPKSVIDLAKELNMPAPYQYVLLLPSDREQMIANAEFAYAKSRNRDPQRIEETWFDFHIHGGKLEPYVQRQTYR